MEPSLSLVRLCSSFLDADSYVVHFGQLMPEFSFEEEESSDVTVYVSLETKHS